MNLRKLQDKQFPQDEEIANAIESAIGYENPPAGTDFPQQIWDVVFSNALRGNTLFPLRKEWATAENPQDKRTILELLRKKAYQAAVLGTTKMWRAYQQQPASWNGRGSAPDSFYEWLDTKKGKY